MARAMAERCDSAGTISALADWLELSLDLVDRCPDGWQAVVDELEPCSLAFRDGIGWRVRLPAP